MQTNLPTPTLAPAPNERFFCGIDSCGKSFNSATNLSRHKLVHLPAHLLPTCPFVGPSGQRCQEKYMGRASRIKIHWERHHQEAGPYLPVKWPSRASLAFITDIASETNNPPISSATQYLQFITNVHPSLDNGGHYKVHHGQYQPVPVPPFNREVENQDWDLSLTGNPSGSSLSSILDPE